MPVVFIVRDLPVVLKYVACGICSVYVPHRRSARHSSFRYKVQVSLREVK